MLGRPQDYFPALAVIRPALVFGMLTLVALLTNPMNIVPKTFLQNTQVKLFLALLALMIIGIPFSLYPRASFMSIFFQYSIVVLFFFIFIVLIDSTSKLLKVIFLGCLSVGLYSGFSLALGKFIDQRLMFGGMFDPNDLSFFILSLLPFNLLFLRKGVPSWRKLVCVASFITGVTIILLTGSRGGFLGLTVVFLILFFTKTHVMKLPMKILILVLCAFLIVFNLSKIDISRFQGIASIEDDYNVQDETGRINIWKIGLRTMLTNPLTGVGVSCFSEAVGLDRARRGLEKTRWQEAHNMLIQIGGETGVIGLFLFILISFNIFRVFQRAKKSRQSADSVRIGEVGIAGFAGHFVAGIFLSQAYSVYWVFYVVVSVVLIRIMATEQGEDKDKVVRPNSIRFGASTRGTYRWSQSFTTKNGLRKEG